MNAVRIQITKWVDDYQPGIVECRLRDAAGRDWCFVHKLPYFTADNLGPESSYPHPGVLPVEIMRQWNDDRGQLISRINTDNPLGIETTSGETEFEVFTESLCEY